MKNLWSSWRNQYIGNIANSKGDSCFLCEATEAGFDNEQVVHIGDTAIIIMNKYPYNNGHLLISPKRHIASILDLSKEEYSEINDLVSLSVKALNELYKPQGINIGVNMGEAAGAGVPGHLHYHVLPRWLGDTNFMLTVADIKVVSEAMEIGSEKLREFFNTHKDAN